MSGPQAHALKIANHAPSRSSARFLNPIQHAVAPSGINTSTSPGPQVPTTDTVSTAGTGMTAMDTSTGIADLDLGGDPVDTTQTTSGDGWTSTETVHYVPNADGSYTLDISSSDSYGDTSAAGSDISGMDPGSVPSGGTDSYSISISVNADGSMTLATSQDSLDSYSESGTMEGSSDSGTWTGSGSDTYHSTDTVTFNTDGSSTETSSVSSHSSDKYSFSDSGTSGDGGAFTLTGSGCDTFDYSEDDTADGGVSRNENDTESQQISLDGTGGDGAHVTADVSETVGYIDALTPSTDGSGDSSETVTNTDVGSETYTYDGAGTFYDGASFSGNETKSDTFNDLETVVLATSGGMVSQVSDDVTDQGTNSLQYDISVSGVPEDDGTATDSEEDTGSSQGSYLNTQHVSPGLTINSSHTVSSQSSETSGTDSGGAFGSTGQSATDLTLTETNGQLTGDDQSPPTTPGTSFGSPPSGMQFFQDHYTVSMEADAEASDELGNVAYQSGNDQILLAQAPAQPPALNQQPQQPQNIQILPRVVDYSYEQAVSVNDVEKLEHIRDTYESQIQSYQDRVEFLLDQAERIRNAAALGVKVKPPFGFEEITLALATGIRTRLGAKFNIANLGYAQVLEGLAQFYTLEVNRLEASVVNINNAIIFLLSKKDDGGGNNP